MSSTQSLENLIETIWAKREKRETWQAIGDYYGVHRIIVWRIANDGYEPKDNKIRTALGLPEVIEVKQYRDSKGRFIRKFSE